MPPKGGLSTTNTSLANIFASLARGGVGMDIMEAPMPPKCGLSTTNTSLVHSCVLALSFVALLQLI